jgi:DNA-binding transcriptional MerR regulator
MLRIGEVAKIAGVSTRAIRHYHAVGALPEPDRRANGYREYTTRDVLLLVRLVRLAELGLSLDEIRDAISDESERELRSILGDIVVDLDAQSEELARRRRTIAEVLNRDGDLAASPAIAALLVRLRGVVNDANLAAREQEILEVAEATMPAEQFADLAQAYTKLLDDPEIVATARDFAARFERLTDEDAHDPEVVAVAELIASQGAAFTPASRTDGVNQSAWEMFLQSLTTAQRHAVTLAAARWQS